MEALPIQINWLDNLHVSHPAIVEFHKEICFVSQDGYRFGHLVHCLTEEAFGDHPARCSGTTLMTHKNKRQAGHA
jgi:hypothetical protein